MDILEVKADLEERFPQWASRIGRLRFQAAPVATADNDGSVIYYNDRFMSSITRENRTFYMARQLLHIQLAHHARRAGRDRAVWKRASDAVVDGMLRQEGFQLPQEVSVLWDAKQQSTEEVYDIFYAQGDTEAEEDAFFEKLTPDEPDLVGGEESDSHNIAIEEAGLATVIAGLSDLLRPSMQIDFDWFPGTTIRDGMLRYDFRPYPVSCAEILLDTSASVDAQLLRRFVRGVKGLLREDAVVRVGCFDTRFYGFQDINTEEDIENLTFHGSGGTNFTVAVNAFTGDAENQIIFTDGYAEMPEQSCDAIWVVYGSMPIHPKGGRVIYAKETEEKEKHEVDFLIT